MFIYRSLNCVQALNLHCNIFLYLFHRLLDARTCIEIKHPWRHVWKWLDTSAIINTSIAALLHGRRVTQGWQHLWLNFPCVTCYDVNCSVYLSNCNVTCCTPKVNLDSQWCMLPYLGLNDPPKPQDEKLGTVESLISDSMNLLFPDNVGLWICRH